MNVCACLHYTYVFHLRVPFLEDPNMLCDFDDMFISAQIVKASFLGIWGWDMLIV